MMQPALWPGAAVFQHPNGMQQVGDPMQGTPQAWMSYAGMPVMQPFMPPLMQPSFLPDAIVMQTHSGKAAQSAAAHTRQGTSENGGQATRSADAPPTHAKHHPERTLPSSFSFEGCGAAISYHLGVYGAVTELFGKEFLQASGVKWVGTSSGSIAALIAALGLDAEFWKARLQVLWGPIADRCFGLLQVDEFVAEALDEMLEAFEGHAYEHLRERLFVSVTEFPFSNTMVTEWASDAHVKSVILASCFIPATALYPVRIGLCFAIDGGFSLNNPRLDTQTLLVSPARTPGSDIRPEAKARFRDVIGAPQRERFGGLYSSGFADAQDFFQPSQVHVRESVSALPQTKCGQCYYYLMRQRCCMALRVSLFWLVLFLQVLLMPLCWAAFSALCKHNLRQQRPPPLPAPPASAPAQIPTADIEEGGGGAERKAEAERGEHIGATNGVAGGGGANGGGGGGMMVGRG